MKLTDIKPRAIDILESIENTTFSYSGESDSNGYSVYFNVSHGDNSVKVRISDHSTTNIDRMRNEVCLDATRMNEDFLIERFICEICYKLNIEGFECGKTDHTLKNGKIVKVFGYFRSK